MKCLEAQLVLVPSMLLNHLESNDSSVADLLDLEKMVETFGLETTASLVCLNRLYNSESSKNLLEPLFASFQQFDWNAEPMSVLRDKNPALAIRLTKLVEGQLIEGKTVSEQFVTGIDNRNSNVMDNDDATPKQLYVPEIFLIAGHTYGVRLTALSRTSRIPSVATSTVWVVNQLGKFFNISQIAQTAIFKEHVKTAML